MDAAGARMVATTIGALFRSIHDRFREHVEGLDARALNWAPTEGANSIAILVTHTLGSEHEMLRAVRNISSRRDRDSEFVARNATASDLLGLIERANDDLDEHIGAIIAEDLTAQRPRGDRPPRPGLEWLLSNYGHAREHLAQLELTKQLYEAAQR